jgi:hypothetical protein
VDLVMQFERQRRAAEEASGGRTHPRDDLERLKWEHWQKPYFERCPENVARDQNQGVRSYLSSSLDEEDPVAADGLLGDKAGWRKRSNVATIALKIVDYQRVVPGSDWLITACGEIPALLVKGFKRLAGLALSQMQNGHSPQAGEVKGCHVEGDVVGLTCRVDPTAITKVKHEVYPLIEVSYSDQGQIYAVDLMDRPSGEELAKRAPRRLARLYQWEGDTGMKSVILEKLGKAPAPPTPVQTSRLAALAETGTVDGLVVKALQHRTSERCGVEAIKAARARPIAYGDFGIIAMMRQGRP